MRSPRFAALLMLLATGLLLALANLWYAARRSTIPLALDTTVADKAIRREKHPGFDDVHLLKLSDGTWLQVDQVVFDALVEGERIRKDAWSRQLAHGNATLELVWSSDLRGLIPVMVASLVVMAVTGGWSLRRETIP